MLKHVTVLKDEAVAGLNIKADGIYVDATLGGAGHSKEILKHLTTGFLYCFDQDQFAINKAKENLSEFNNFHIFHDNFANLTKNLATKGVTKIDGILFDLGLSSFQIDDRERGFSYLSDHTLDMRMDKTQTLSAKEIVNTYSLEQLTHIFRVYGEEKNGYFIAKEIINNRPLETTAQLVRITDKINYKTAGHSAKRVFQALRIAVNNELEVLESALKQALELLNANGRLVVITFHSLEDRIVKHFIKDNATINLPKNLPIVNLPTPKLTIINRKPILPGEEELKLNSRSHSAKLRIAAKN